MNSLVNPYIQDILSQPEVLLSALPRFDLAALRPLAAAIAAGRIKRVILTGMGASLHAATTAWLLLARRGIPASMVDAAELVHYAGDLLAPRTLLWVISQSGRSAELLPLIESVQSRPAIRLLATTNDPDSPLAKAAEFSQPIHSPVEQTVSTITYSNTLASIQLAALALSGQPTAPALASLQQAAGNAQAYLRDWQGHVQFMLKHIGRPRHLVIVGRGPSLAAVHTGALIQGEAAKMPCVAMNAAEFRHGPLEMINSELTVLVLAGEPETQELNRRLCADVLAYQGKAWWICASPDADLPNLPMPTAAGIGLPLAEILPLQLLTIALAERAGLEAGHFIRSGKVTLSE